MFGATISPQPEEGNLSSSFWREHSLLIGLSILAFILIFLLSNPKQLFYSQQYSRVLFIDSELHVSSGNEIPVLLKMDISSSQQLGELPTEFGDWRGLDFDASTVEEALEADCLLMRSYSKPGLYQPIFLMVMQGELRTSFHPPPVCYVALGWTIEGEGKETIPIVNTAWAVEKPEEWSSIVDSPEYRSPYFGGSISAKRLVVFKGTKEDIKERRVALYFYVRDNELMSNRVTMIRVSALVPVSGSYEGIVNLEKEFVSDVFPYMFEVRKQEQGEMIIVHLAKLGVGGCLLLAFLFSIPLAIIIYPHIHRPSVGGEKKPEIAGKTSHPT